MLEVRLLLEWSAEENVLHKWAEYRLIGGCPRLLKEVTLDEVVTSGQIDLSPSDPQSHPAFLDGFFAGIEFPVASTRLENGRLILAHRPGLMVKPGTWHQTRKAVFGVAPKGEERRAFERYIAANRPGPKGFHVNYNSWWTSPVPYKESDILGIEAIFKEKLYKPHGVSFDTFCIDMGWSDVKSVWEIDKGLFPDGFTKIQRAAERMKANLGLWISPCSAYPGAVDNEQAARDGYETFVDGPRYACLAGERYRARLTDCLVRMVTENGVRHIKFDGYRPQCTEAGHGHEPGALGCEAVAQGMISVFEAVRRAAPDTWMETTCFGWNPSPWWLFYADSVIGTYGDDAPYGRVPSPVYRESYTTARDYFNLQGADLLPIPDVAQEVLGVVHQTGDDLLNDAVMTIMRGHMFLPAYINPAYMSDRRWKSLADLLKWARANAPLLQETEPLLPESWLQGKTPRFTNDSPMPREPYGYAHWGDGKGLVALRNPWITPQTFKLKLGALAKDSSAVSIYPEPRLYMRDLRSGDTIDVPLAPYETVVLSIGRNATEGLPDASKVERRIKSDVTERALTRVKLDGAGEAFGPDWTDPMAGAESGTSLSLEADVTVEAPDADLLVLLEGTSSQNAPYCRLLVDGKERPMTMSGSDAGWAATGLPKPEHWLFLTAPLRSGKNRIKLDLLAGDECQKLSAFIWAKMPGKPGQPLPAPEMVSRDAVPLLEPIETRTIPITSKAVKSTIDRIDGIYLDWLEPLSVSQGWGTLQRNKSVWEKPLVIAGTRYLRGLGTHAPSRITYALDGKYRRFQASVGADSATSPTVSFEVWVDGEKRWESGLMKREDAARPVDLDITGAKVLELIVGDGGNGINADHADWADARLMR